MLRQCWAGLTQLEWYHALKKSRNVFVCPFVLNWDYLRPDQILKSLTPKASTDFKLIWYYGYLTQATAEANNTSASSEARNVYETLMEEICGGTKPYLPPQVLEQEHHKCLNKALHSFDSKKKMGGEEMATKFKQLLVKVRSSLFNSNCFLQTGSWIVNSGMKGYHFKKPACP